MESSNLQYEYLKKMSPQQKLETAMTLYYSAREIKSAWLRQLYADWSNQQVEEKVREVFINARS
jgi:hypothetical protein